MEIFAPPGMEELTSQIQGMFQNMGSSRKKTRKLRIREAKKLLTEEEAARLINDEELKLNAVQNVEQNGIVFLDEIDKITSRSEVSGTDVSRQGVQRDLLPLVEGTTISTKYGMIRTDHILFIASGAFHLAKPSDLIPELQGRFPIRVELASLSADDFRQILTNTDACLIRQYQALLKTEGIELNFSDDAIKRLAEIAFQSTKEPKILAPGACIPSWKNYWKIYRLTLPATVRPHMSSMLHTLTNVLKGSLKVKIWLVTCCKNTSLYVARTYSTRTLITREEIYF